MWAQGLTIGVLIAAGVLTHSIHSKQEDNGPVRHLVRIAQIVIYHEDLNFSS